MVRELESESALELAWEPVVQAMVMVKESGLAVVLELGLGLALELELVPLAPTLHFLPTVSLGNQTTDLLPDCEAHQTASR